MLRTTISDRTLDVTLNADHPAFAALYQPLQAMETAAAAELRTALELLLLSLGRSTVQLEGSGRQFDDLLETWSTTYSRMLQKS